MNRRAMGGVRTSTAAGLAALALLAAGCGTQAGKQADPPLAGARIGGEFALLDKDGQTVRYSDFAGKYRIVYFGYTFCPDVCPLDLQKLVQGLQMAEKRDPLLAGAIQPLFVTIDPARDTPEVVGEYAAAFSPRLIGLTGSEEQVAAAAKAFAVYRVRGTDSPGGSYLMDHSRIAFLMDRDGKPLAMLPVDRTPQDVAAEIERWTA
jgi:protein SCO1/2